MHWRGLLVCALLWAVALLLGRQTRDASPDVRPISLEFAWTVDRAQAVLKNWDTTLVKQSLASLGWDYGFILGYTAAAVATLWLVFPSSPRRALILSIPVAAGLFDYVENSALVVGLATAPRPSPVTFALAGVAASIKFALLGVSLVLFLVGLVRWLRALAPTA